MAIVYIYRYHFFFISVSLSIIQSGFSVQFIICFQLLVQRDAAVGIMMTMTTIMTKLTMMTIRMWRGGGGGVGDCTENASSSYAIIEIQRLG